jgi:Zn-dependent protease with chaperone function
VPSVDVEVRPALRPDALGNDSTMRFVVLLLTVVTASVYLFQSLWFVARGNVFIDAVQRCGSTDTGAGLLGITTADAQRQLACQSGVSREQVLFAATGAALVLLTAWVLYRVRPTWREHRDHLTPLDPRDGAALAAGVEDMCRAAGLDRVPGIRVDATNPAVRAFAYGSGTDIRIGATGGLIVQAALDPPAYRAVVRHELGHVANRDVPWTYFTVSVWWAFLVCAVAPVVVIFAIRDPGYVLRLGLRTAHTRNAHQTDTVK